MPLNKYNTRSFYRQLYGGQLVTVTLLKRNDDLQQGTVRSIRLFGCRKSSIRKSGEAIQGDMPTERTTVWHIPRTELRRTGVNYLNVLDRFVDSEGRVWQPEAPQSLDIRLFENYIDVQCVSVDPPLGS